MTKAPDKPCARCHEGERMPLQSYCKPCLLAYNAARREAVKAGKIVIQKQKARAYVPRRKTDPEFEFNALAQRFLSGRI